MPQNQITTNLKTRQVNSFTFSLKIAGKTIIKPQSKPAIFAHCDLCSEQASGTTAELRAIGWEISQADAFCPNHAEMI